jgi:hypothetical protein
MLWLDGLVMNPDRTARNPNLLWWRDELWLIDHGAALGFQYALPNVDPAAARRPYTLREAHLFQSRASEVSAVDELFASRLSRELVDDAVEAVPDEFVVPLLGVPSPTPAAIRARRAAYADYLWRRLDAPRPFLTPVVAPPNDQRGRSRPAWITRRG